MKRALALSGLLVVVATAIASGQSAAVQTPPGYPAVGQPVKITVSSTGAEPRRALRYTVPNGYRAGMNMDMTMSMGMSMGDQSMPAMDMPAMRVGANLEVTSVSAAGDISYTLNFTGVSLPGGGDASAMGLDAVNADFKNIKGIAISTNRGITKDLKLDASQVANPQMSQMLDSVKTSLNSLSMPLPEEAIGVGAHWQVRQALNSGGATLFQNVECELTAVDAKSATVKVTLDQTAPKQPFNSPMVPPGTDMSIESMTGSGTGTLNIAFDALVPTSEMNAKSTMVMAISMNGQTQRMTAQTTLKMAVAPVKK